MRKNKCPQAINAAISLENGAEKDGQIACSAVESEQPPGAVGGMIRQGGTVHPYSTTEIRGKSTEYYKVICIIKNRIAKGRLRAQRARGQSLRGQKGVMSWGNDNNGWER